MSESHPPLKIGELVRNNNTRRGEQTMVVWRLERSYAVLRPVGAYPDDPSRLRIALRRIHLDGLPRDIEWNRVTP